VCRNQTGKAGTIAGHITVAKQANGDSCAANDAE
jgi:hypothetical protein